MIQFAVYNIFSLQIDNQQQQQVNVIGSELGQSKTNDNWRTSSVQIIVIATETLSANLHDNENSISG